MSSGMKVAVIGGGVGGLVAAHGLVSAGFDAHVFEASDRVGGVVSTTTLDGFVRESAASSFLGGPARGALALCHELGVPVEHASPRAKRRWVYLDGKLRALPRNPIEFIRSDLMTWRGKVALLREPFAPPRKGPDDESMHDFAARRFGAEAARAIFAPFVTGIFAADAHDVSLEAGFPRLAAFDAEGGIVRGAAKQMGKSLLARVSGKRTTSKTESGMWAPVGGLQALVDGLARTLGARVKTRSAVRALSPATNGVLVDGERWDAAVLATPAYQGADLVAPSMPELATRLRVFERSPVALVYLGFAAGAVPKADDGFGFLTALGEDLRVLGVVFESTVWSHRAPEGQVLLRCIFGGGRDPEATKMSDAELVDQARRDLAKVLDAKASPTHASVLRWTHGLAAYPVGHRDQVRAAVAVGRSQRIALAGADYRGAGVNDLCADRDVIVSELRTWT